MYPASITTICGGRYERIDSMTYRKWFWGAFFMLSAIFVVASQVTDFVEIGLWSILGAILLIALCIYSIPHRNFFGIFIPLALLYELFWQPLHGAYISIWALLTAAVMAAIGCSCLFHKHPPEWRKKMEKGHHLHSVCDTTDDNHPCAQVNFGASTQYLHATALQTGQFTVSFGALEVYFDQAFLSENGAEVYVDCRFGSIEMYIPRTWQVKSQVQATLGSAAIDDNPANSETPTLLISGNVSFGSVEVHYV